MTTLSIQCPCGAIHMTLTGEPLAQFYCHCDDCQAVHSAAYVPAAMYRIDQTHVTSGEPRYWKRKTTVRASCPECATRMYAEPAGLGVRSISALLLPPGTFRPGFHMQCQHALRPVRDDLPHFLEFPPAFGGSDARTDW